MTITLNEQKKAKVKASYQAVQHYETSITELIQLIGTLVSNMPGMQSGRVHYRNLEIEKNLLAQRENKGKYEAFTSLYSRRTRLVD